MWNLCLTKKISKMKKGFLSLLLCFWFCVFSVSCTQTTDDITSVSKVIEDHPEAHSIMFFDPNTTYINEGDKSVLPKKLDYITFSVGFCYIKFIGENELKVFVDDEPNDGFRGYMHYSISNSNDDFLLRLDQCLYFYMTERNELIASFNTKSSTERMMEYYNILYNKGQSLKRPTLEKLKLLINKYKNGIEYYSFDE